MPRFNFTFQEASPLITYSGLWTEGSPKNDSDAAQYDGSFAVTDNDGTTAEFAFNGTGVAIFGALRVNHGNYSVELDHNGRPSLHNGNGYVFKHLLWETYGLPYGKHTAKVTNVPLPAPKQNFFDLDYVTIERQIGKDSDNIFNVTLENTSPLVQYSGAWQPDQEGPRNQTVELDSEVSITFQGCCIELYGMYANARYSVSVDNRTAEDMNGRDIDLDQMMWHPNTLLYLVDGLAEDMNHTITMKTTQTSPNRPFFFDHAVASSTRNLSFMSTSSDSRGSVSGSNTQSSPLGLALGLSIGGVVFLVLLVAAFVLLRRRHRTLHMDDAGHVEPYVPHPWMKMNQARSFPNQPSTFQLSTVVSGWRRISGDGQTSSGSPRSGIWDHSSMRWRRRSSATPPVPNQHGKGRQFAVTNTPSSRFSQQSFVTSEVPSQEEDAGPVAEMASRVPPAYNPEWGVSR